MTKPDISMCTRCGKREATEVHHLDGDHDNNAPENLMKICARCHAELHNIQPNLAEAKVQYENLKDLENTRIRIENRIRGLKRKWGISTELLEEEAKTVKGLERKVEKKLVGIVKDYEIFKWLIEIRGIAGKTAAELIALIGDIGRFRMVSSLWHYSGLHVDEGKAPRMRKGKQGDYHPKLKSLCLGIIGKNFLRSKSPYRRFYDEKKKYYEENREWTKGHRHKAAIRYMVKQFIKDLWLKWRELEGLTITSPRPQDQPNPVVKTVPVLRHPAAGVGDTGRRASTPQACTPQVRYATRRPLPITEAHPQDQPTFKMKTVTNLRRPAGVGDAASGSDPHESETQRDRAPPAGLRITSPHPQDKPTQLMQTEKQLRRPAGAGDTGGGPAHDIRENHEEPVPSAALYRSPKPIRRTKPICILKTREEIRRPAGVGDVASGPAQVQRETQVQPSPPAGSNHSFVLQNGGLTVNC